MSSTPLALGTEEIGMRRTVRKQRSNFPRDEGSEGLIQQPVAFSLGYVPPAEYTRLKTKWMLLNGPSPVVTRRLFRHQSGS